MKVLHLPHNVASKISITVDALNSKGIDAKGIAINNQANQNARNILTINPAAYSFLEPGKYFSVIKSFYKLYRLIEWADIVHWYFDYRVLHSAWALNHIRKLDKPAVVEWAGSDIRIPEILAKNNPYYAASFKEDYEYQYESLGHSRDMQQKFRAAGFTALVRPELEDFIQRDIFPDYYKINNRIDVKNIQPCYPAVDNKKPLVIHASTARHAKGTGYILNAIEALKSRFDLEFVLIENMPALKIHELMKRADIVIDQLILGAFGTTALEAMAYGKPVICYIEPELEKKTGESLPIVNASPDTIAEKLEILIQSPEMRNEKGKQGRGYVEQYHNAEKIALQLIDIYRGIIDRKKK